MSEKFTEYSEKGKEILRVIEVTLRGLEIIYNINYAGPHHDVARGFLNDIYEFESEAAHGSRVMAEAKKREKENADKSGG